MLNYTGRVHFFDLMFWMFTMKMDCFLYAVFQDIINVVQPLRVACMKFHKQPLRNVSYLVESLQLIILLI